VADQYAEEEKHDTDDDVDSDVRPDSASKTGDMTL
jgi:hypothetical protein